MDYRHRPRGVADIRIIRLNLKKTKYQTCEMDIFSINSHSKEEKRLKISELSISSQKLENKEK